METITLGAGCFWCVEAVYLKLKGVSRVKSGYSGGHVKNPTYEQVCTKTTGHVEVCQLDFDPKQTSLANIFEVFFRIHDPTSKDKQGEDVGPQYRSAVFYHSEEQRQQAESLIGDFNKLNTFGKPVVTVVEKFTEFFPAESYHDNYFALHGSQPYCALVVAPKVEKFEKVFARYLKEKHS